MDAGLQGVRVCVMVTAPHPSPLSQWLDGGVGSQQ
jgi:hypothetical protein